VFSQSFVDELASRVAEVVLERQARRSDWTDVVGCAAHLGVSVGSVRALVRRKLIPVHRLPGTNRLLFDLAEIDVAVRESA
jgi:hypothetical protein